MGVDLSLGYTRQILSAAMRNGLRRNEAAYVLATAFWETAHTMEPVREAFWLSDDWRERNLRYYPWYGRGFVQMTWERNYHRASAELGLDLTSDPDKVMDPDISAEILVIGARDGWFTGKKLSDYLTPQESNYRGARRIINGTDKAAAIAEIAREYEAALLADGYGPENTTPIANDRRDGSPPRRNIMASTTNQATLAAAATTLAGQSETARELVGSYSEVFGVPPQVVFAAVVIGALVWVFRERLRKWAEGDR